MDVSLTQFDRLRFPGKIHGLTLIELLLVVALMGILMGMAAPSFNDLLLDHRRTTQLNTLAAHLNYARSEAIKHGHWVVVCKSVDGQQCNNSEDWDSGWILFADKNRDRQRNADEPVIYSKQATTALNIRYGGFPSSNYVIYYPNGTSLGNGTFIFCDRRGASHARAVILAKSGRLRSSDQAANGDALSCSG